MKFTSEGKQILEILSAQALAHIRDYVESGSSVDRDRVQVSVGVFGSAAESEFGIDIGDIAEWGREGIYADMTERSMLQLAVGLATVKRFSPKDLPILHSEVLALTPESFMDIVNDKAITYLGIASMALLLADSGQTHTLVDVIELIREEYAVLPGI